MKGSAKRRKLVTAALVLVPITLMIGLVSESVTLYRLFCAATGFGGTTQRAAAVNEKPSDKTIVVRFDTNTAPDLPWKFEPEKIQVTTHLGERTLVWFRAENDGKETMTGRAGYNVTPPRVGPYFTKTECFCFTSEKLAPGESARMPVVFYVDPKLASEVTETVHAITLSYTFYRAKDDGTARDLAKAAATAKTQLAAPLYSKTTPAWN